MALPNWSETDKYNLTLKQTGKYSFNNFIYVDFVDGKYIGDGNVIPDMRFWTHLEKRIIKEDGSFEIFKYTEGSYIFHDFYPNPFFHLYKDLQKNNKNTLILKVKKDSHISDFIKIINSSFFVTNNEHNIIKFRPFYNKKNRYSELLIVFKNLKNGSFTLTFDNIIFEDEYYKNFFINSIGELIARTEFFNSFFYEFNIY